MKVIPDSMCTHLSHGVDATGIEMSYINTETSGESSDNVSKGVTDERSRLIRQTRDSFKDNKCGLQFFRHCV